MRKFKDIEILVLETELHYQARREPQMVYFYLPLPSVCRSSGLAS